MKYYPITSLIFWPLTVTNTPQFSVVVNNKNAHISFYHGCGKKRPFLNYTQMAMSLPLITGAVFLLTLNQKQHGELFNGFSI
jgi:hypothetical protein